MMRMPTGDIFESLQQAYVPKRNKDRLIEPNEYKGVVGREIPDITVDVTYYNPISKECKTEKASLRELLGNDPFLMAWQPGASTLYEGQCEFYSQKAGTSGCTGELLGLDASCPALGELGYKNVFVCSTKTSAQQAQVFEDRNSALINKNVRFLSDPQGRLAQFLGLYLTEDDFVNKTTKETAHVKFVERINLFGVGRRVTDFICAAQMPNPKSPITNTVRLPDYVKDMQAARKASEAAKKTAEAKDGEAATRKEKGLEKAAIPAASAPATLPNAGM